MEETAAGKSRKKKAFILIVPVVAVIALTVGIILYRQSDSAQIKKHLDLGARYMQELQYEQAVIEFTKAFELDPDNPVITGNLVEAYIGWADELVAAEQYDRAIEILTQGYELTGDERLGEKLADIQESSQREILLKLTNTIKDDMAEIGHDGMYFGKYRTFDEKSVLFKTVIDDLNDYIAKIEQFPDACGEELFPKTGVDAMCAGLTGNPHNSLPDILTPGYAYAALSIFYLHTGDMENCLKARTKLAECIGDESIISDHLDDTGAYKYDKYGRMLESNGSTGNGVFSFTYNDESADNPMRTDTYYIYECVYENGRIVSGRTTHPDDSSYLQEESYSYSGDTVTLTYYTDISVMQYYTTEEFMIDKFGNEVDGSRHVVSD